MIRKPQSCSGCPLHGHSTTGFVPATGSGDNGVLIVLEAAGADEGKGRSASGGQSGVLSIQ